MKTIKVSKKIIKMYRIKKKIRIFFDNHKMTVVSEEARKRMQ